MVVYSQSTYKSVTHIQQIAKAVFVIYVPFVQMQNEHWDSNNEYVYNICTKYHKLLSFYLLTLFHLSTVKNKCKQLHHKSETSCDLIPCTYTHLELHNAIIHILMSSIVKTRGKCNTFYVTFHLKGVEVFSSLQSLPILFNASTFFDDTSLLFDLMQPIYFWCYQIIDLWRQQKKRFYWKLFG